MDISEFGRLSFDMVSPNFKHFGSIKSHKQKRKTEAKQRLELFDFARFGTFLGHDAWTWSESESSVSKGSVNVHIKTQQGTECDYTFVVTWSNNKPMAQLKEVSNA